MCINMEDTQKVVQMEGTIIFDHTVTFFQRRDNSYEKEYWNDLIEY